MCMHACFIFKNLVGEVEIAASAVDFCNIVPIFISQGA